MSDKRFEEYQKKLIEINDTFEKIKKKENNNEKLNELNELIKKCNTIEDIIIEYLKVIKLLKPKEFLEELNKYEMALSKENISINFPGDFNDKINAYDKIILLFLQILDLKSKTAKERYKELLSMQDKYRQLQKIKYKINFQLLPLDNIELYLNILYLIAYGGIIYTIKEYFSYFNNFKDEDDKNYDKNEANEINKLKEQINNSIINDTKLYNEYNLRKDNLLLFRAVHNNKFNIYINEFFSFYHKVNNNFHKRFKNQIKNKEDIDLYEKFIYFLSYYNFFLLDYNYIHIWNESFISLDIEEIKLDIENRKSVFKSRQKEILLENDNKDIILKYEEKEFIIKNFQKYSYNALIDYLYNKTILTTIDEFSLRKFVKLQYLDRYIHETILNKKWEKFYYEVFNSKTIKCLIKKVYKYGDKISIDECKKIIDNVCFFNFNTYFYGQTSSFYNVFISSLLDQDGNRNKDKIKFYLIIFITFIHEILGHCFVLIQRFLYDDKIMSPKTTNLNYSYYSNKRTLESGEYIIIQLFGRKIEKLTMKEIWYIFDLENYKLSCEEFLGNFKKCSSIEYNNTIPDIIKDLFEDEKINEYSTIYIDSYYSKGEHVNNVISLFEENEIICNPFLLDIND